MAKVGFDTRKVGGPQFRAHVLPLPFSFFFLSLGIFSCLFFTLCGSYRGILVVFWSSRTLKCARGDSHDSPRAKTRTVPADQNTTKIPREDPQREKKETKMGMGEEKKKENLGGPEEGGPAGRPTDGGPTGRGLTDA